jgi:tRNA A-37 threonylcarbamoyl transferase component Bud32
MEDLTATKEGLGAALAISIPGLLLSGVIGRGGQATVYKGIDESDGAVVAVKVLHGGPFADEFSRQRLEREIIALRCLRHPNIVSYIASGQSPGGHDYLVMRYIEGRTLAEFWQDVWSTPAGHGGLERMLRVFVTICKAVGAAHKSGITHRDLCPSNIRIDREGEPHILDFGLARSAFDAFIGPGGSAASVTGQFHGSLAYASPEQARGRPDAIDIRSDVYALGVMLYQVVSGGAFPYSVTGDLTEVLDCIVHSVPVSPSKGRLSSLNQAVDSVVLKALEKDPDLRQQSASELGRDIENCLAGQERTGPGGKRKKWVGLAAFLALALASLAGLVAHELRPATRGRGMPGSSTTEPAVAIAPPRLRENEPATARRVDLLKIVDPARDVGHRGIWAFRDGALVSHAPDSANELEFPYAVPAEYDYRVSFVVEGTKNTKLMFFFPAGGHQIAWVVGDRENRACGIDLVDGKDDSHNITTRWGKQWIDPGRPQTTLLKVRRDHVEAYLDDDLICEYKTDYHEIGLRDWMKFKRPDTVGLMFSMAGVKVEKAEIVEITGEGKEVR